jgi:hypothetical protein
MTVPERFRSFYERFQSCVTFLRRTTGIRIININDKKTSINAKERHETIESAHKTIENGQERLTVRNV